MSSIISLILDTEGGVINANSRMISNPPTILRNTASHSSP
jgi:hypothetical protein